MNYFPNKLMFLLKLVVSYGYDLIRYFRHSNSFVHKNSLQKYESSIIFYYHVIEKGLTMPDVRLGFGEEKLRALMGLCRAYQADGYDVEREAFRHAVSVLKEYIEFHRENNCELNENLKNEIENLLSCFPQYTVSGQLEMTSELLFTERNSNFTDFCRSRRTIRNYSCDDIPDSILTACAKLAQKSPSACNRQPSRLYVVKGKVQQEKILALQNGNRGFGNLASVLIVFTSDISSFRQQGERNDLYLNSGMFIMTFMYALHHYGIGSCALNWSVNFIRDKKLRRIINVPENETITLILSCGYLPEKVKIASSPRKDISDVIHFV
jgi:nitroreductase